MNPSLASVSRRNFLAISGAASAALLARGVCKGALADADDAASVPPATKKKKAIGLELYSVRDELARDLPNTLKTVARIGYEVVEFFSPYFSWSIPRAKEVGNLLRDFGLRCHSTHNGLESFTARGMPKAIEINQILGANYIILSSAGNVRGAEGWKKLGGQLTEAVDQLKPHGLTAGYHNHGAEWRKVDGELRIMDVLAANTPKDFVLQLDVGTCVEAGSDPVAWVNANPGRIKSVHLKDWAPGRDADQKGFRVLFGEGVTPWKELLAALETVGGTEDYLIEQEGSRYSEFETAQKCLEAWNKMEG